MTVVLRSGSQSSLGSTVLEQGLPASKNKKSFLAGGLASEESLGLRDPLA